MAYRITERCTNCGECLTAYPVEAISPGEQKPAIDLDICTECGTCSDICPMQAIAGE